jgi:hypothetical protein
MVVIYTLFELFGNVDFRNKHRIIDLLFAQEIGKQDRNGLTEDTPKTEDFL